MRLLSRAGGLGRGTIRALPLVLGFLPGNILGLAPVAAAQNQDAPYRVAVDVSLVVLHATVIDRKGHSVSGLTREDFRVYDQGVVQDILLFRHEDIPVTVGLVVDHSGSMRAKVRDVIAAAESFAVASNSGDEMFVVNFNEKVSLGLPRGDRFTGSPAELKGAISRTQANGKTALYDAIAVSLSQLQEGDSDKKVLLVISDGGDNASSHSLSEVLRIAGQSDAIIYTIGLFDKDSTDRNPKALESLARATGGEAFFPKETASVVAICRQIAKDIRSQYTLGYSPTPASTESAYRTIRVVASAPHYANLSVRTRAGYIPANRTRRQTDSTGRGK